MSEKEMQRALELDGDKLRALTGEDHGPFEVQISRSICERCEGQGSYHICEDNGEGDPQIEECPDCAGSGMNQVGVFHPVCDRHCHMCEGSDHHWSYDGREDISGNPLMGCRHCPALRAMTDEDDGIEQIEAPKVDQFFCVHCGAIWSLEDASDAACRCDGGMS